MRAHAAGSCMRGGGAGDVSDPQWALLEPAGGKAGIGGGRSSNHNSPMLELTGREARIGGREVATTLTGARTGEIFAGTSEIFCCDRRRRHIFFWNRRQIFLVRPARATHCFVGTGDIFCWYRRFFFCCDRRRPEFLLRFFFAGTRWCMPTTASEGWWWR